jgi:DNA invertase Pin-like site-specific DNA recombinase
MPLDEYRGLNPHAREFLRVQVPRKMMRQIAGSFAEHEKARLVAKLKGARDRKRAETGKCGGRKSYAEARPEVVALAKELSGQRMSYRKISAELASRGHTTATGRPYVASAVQAMLAG